MMELILAFWLSGQIAGANVYFPQNYEGSRERFRFHCSNQNRTVFCKEFKIPSRLDSDLTMDVAYFGGHGRRLLILESGIHGVETPTGAAVQQLFLEKYLQTFLRQDVDVLLVHALNPYGFKYGRRSDENNIDLNRNFTLNPELYRSQNPEYTRMRSVLEPSGPVGNISLARTRIEVGLIAKYALTGFDRRRANAIITGQYEFPQGLNYGGREPAAQVTIFADFYRRLLARYEDILMLDVHTGLGDKGDLNLIPSPQSTPPGLKELADTFAGVRGVKTVDFAADKKFYSPKGDVLDFIPQLAPQSACVVALAMEYGTIGSTIMRELETVSRIVMENQAHFKGCTSTDVCAEVKRSFVELFNPWEEGWRYTVIAQADKLFSALAVRDQSGSTTTAVP